MGAFQIAESCPRVAVFQARDTEIPPGPGVVRSFGDLFHEKSHRLFVKPFGDKIRCRPATRSGAADEDGGQNDRGTRYSKFMESHENPLSR
jgi:hypothetical protein